ncbi:hypothetical protein [Rhodococcus sp. NPDC049939]|uniref:hypothetical protein n=1 Tax=Rhodococcus sp. NPDC049939 TaxID=3155511 RepID=UPI0033EB91C2
MKALRLSRVASGILIVLPHCRAIGAIGLRAPSVCVKPLSAISASTVWQQGNVTSGQSAMSPVLSYLRSGRHRG